MPVYPPSVFINTGMYELLLSKFMSSIFQSKQITETILIQ